MKPNTKSKFFLLSVLSILVFFVHLLVLRSMVLNSVVNNVARPPSFAYYLPYLWISIGGLLFYKSTKANKSPGRQILAFILTPFILSPVLGIIYVAIILMPIYGLVGKSVLK